MAIFDFWPRYPLLITPAIALLVAYGLAKLPYRIVFVVLGVGMITSLYSWQAGNHTALQHVGSTVKKYQLETGLPVYTSFEPYKFSHLANINASYISDKAFCGSIVITDTQQGPVMANFTEPEFVEMKGSLKVISSYAERQKIVDKLSHFPYSATGNVYRIYIIDKNELCDVEAL
jgi:hypothetical protein